MNDLKASSDLKALDDLGATLDPAPLEPPARLRHRVLNHPILNNRVLSQRVLSQRVLSHRVLNQRVFNQTNLRQRRAWGWRLALAPALAAVVTAAVLALQVIPFGEQGPASQASAARVLAGAAARARQGPAIEPHPDQFVYVESIVLQAEMTLPAINQTVTVAPTDRQIWLSVNGEREGIVRERPRTGANREWISYPLPGCRNGVTVQSEATAPTSCQSNPGYRPNLPTSADAMLDYLYWEYWASTLPRDQSAFQAAAMLIREAYVSPACLSAIFTALSRIGPVTVVGDVTDEAGRAGIAVSLLEVHGTRTDLIFDRTTFAYLGERTVVAQDQDGLKAGQVLTSIAVLKVAIVDRAGQTS